MADVFISYARKDVAFVRKLQSALLVVERDPWVDWKDITPTAEWLLEIKAAIEATDAFVFVLSESAARSETCRIEIDHAVNSGKRLIPLVFEDVEHGNVHPSLASLQWLFFRTSDDFELSFATLLQALDTDLTWVRAHTRLLVRALDWQRRSRDASLLVRGNELTDAETWLAQAPKVDPRATPLQAELIVASRQASNSRQRRLVGALAGGVAVMLVLAVVAWVQRDDAVEQRDVAERQRQIAVARQLAARSAALRSESPRLLESATLLAVESARRADGAEAASSLRATLALLTTLRAQFVMQDAVNMVVFSPDDRHVVAAGDAGVRAWTVADGREVLRVGQAEGVRQISFLAGGKLLAMSGSESVIRVVDFASGRQLLALQHGNRVYALSSSADGRRLASGCDDGFLRVWEVPSGRLVWQTKYDAAVRVVAFSANGTLVAGGSHDDTVRVWNSANGRPVLAGRHEAASASMPLRAGSRDGGVHALAFSADGRYVASGGQDRTARIWDVATGKEVFRARHADAVYAVAFSEPLESLATGGLDGTARLWNLKDGEERFRWVHGGPVEHVRFGSGGVLLTTGGDGTARLWDVESGRETVRMPHQTYVGAAAFDSARTGVVSASWDGVVRVWDGESGEDAFRLRHGAPVRGARFRPDGRQLLTWGTEGKHGSAYLWPLEPKGSMRRLVHPDFVDEARFSPDGQFVATACWDGVLRLWNPTSGEPVRQMTTSSRINATAFSPDSKLIATSGIDEGMARVFRVADGTEVARFVQPAALPTLKRMFPNGSARDVEFSPDGRLLAVAGGDGVARVWNVLDRKQVAAFEQPNFVSNVRFSPNGRYLAAESGDQVIVWRLSGGDKVAVAHHDGGVTEVAFGGDAHLLTAGQDRTAKVWDLPSGRLLATLLHDGTVFAVQMNADRTLVATGSQDRTARVWSTASWQEVSRLGHAETVFDVSFSADNRYVATASDDGTARVAFLGLTDLIALACRRLARNLTNEEWAQYVDDGPPRPSCQLDGISPQRTASTASAGQPNQPFAR